MGTEQEKTPLLTGLLEYMKTNPRPFHVPGHKRGRAMDSEFRQLCGEGVLAADLTNIGPLDDLHQPHSLIKDAQELAAQAFGADYTWFSVQGTSTPIMAMLMAVCKPGEKIILPRNIHRSVLSGLIFSGAQPIFLYPPIDPDLGISHCLTPEQVESALKQHPDAKGVLVINPTYFGFVGDLASIVHIAHGHGVPVLVDEAHGSHLHFHDYLPLSAMQAGADLAASSVHKLGGSLTQSSILNLQGNRIAPQAIQTMLNMLTTTSASFLLLASLDAARRHLALRGERMLEKAMFRAEQTRVAINQIRGLWCPGQELVGCSEGVSGYDPTKLVISLSEVGITGHEGELWLAQHFGVQVELGDLHNLLCVVTGADNAESLQGLVTALRALSEFHHTTGGRRPVCCSYARPQLIMTPRDAFYSPTRVVPLARAIGSVVAEWIMTYPPGIPLILPGEVLDQDTYEDILACQRAGLTMLGTADPELRTIAIVGGA